MVEAPCVHRFSIVGGADAVAVVRLISTGETHLCRVPEGVTLTCTSHVVVPTRFGRDLARVLGPIDDRNRDSYGELIAIHRVADEADIQRSAEYEERSVEALRRCRELADEHGLDMALVRAHFVLDEERLVFFFTAESRVDFRNLVKDLVHEYHMRIELRQIGVRDESRIVGGIGVCGRVLCCNAYGDRLKAVSIKMAKVQGLSLNSSKISGPCGRLLCCLEYEYDFYRQEKRGLPNVGGRLRYRDELYRITEVNVLTGSIRIEGGGQAFAFPASRVYQDPKSQRWTIDEDASQVRSDPTPEPPPATS